MNRLIRRARPKHRGRLILQRIFDAQRPDPQAQVTLAGSSAQQHPEPVVAAHQAVPPMTSA